MTANYVGRIRTVSRDAHPTVHATVILIVTLNDIMLTLTLHIIYLTLQ